MEEREPLAARQVALNKYPALAEMSPNGLCRSELVSLDAAH